MPETKQAEFDQLVSDVHQRERRARRYTAVYSLVPVVLAVAFLGYTAQRVTGLNDELVGLNNELDDLEDMKSALSDDVDALKKTRDQLDAEIVSLGVEIESLAADRESLDKQWSVASRQIRRFVAAAQSLPEELVTAAPISMVVRPRAAYAPIPEQDGVYDFECWIDIPERRRGEIDRVTYLFNHPSFPNRLHESADPTDGFRVAYRGWGALDRVIITLHSVDGIEDQIAYNMDADIRGEDPSSTPPLDQSPSKEALDQGPLTAERPIGRPPKWTPSKKAPVREGAAGEHGGGG